MTIRAAILFFPVILGLLPILRAGYWRWDVLASYGHPILGSAFLHNLGVGMFWLGWFAFLIVGLLGFFGLIPWHADDS